MLFLPSSSSAYLQHSCLENPMDGGAWQAAVHGVTKSWTRLSNFSLTFHFHALEKEMATHSVCLPGESQGQWSLVGCSLWGRTESGMTEATQQQQQQQELKGILLGTGDNNQLNSLLCGCCSVPKPCPTFLQPYGLQHARQKECPVHRTSNRNLSRVRKSQEDSGWNRGSNRGAGEGSSGGWSRYLGLSSIVGTSDFILSEMPWWLLHRDVT